MAHVGPWAFLGCMALTAFAEPAADWRLECAYEIDARLAPAPDSLYATQSLRIQNHSPDSLQQLVLHLYPNAFQDEASPMRRDHWATWNGRLWDELGPEDRGGIEIDELTVDGRADSFHVAHTLLRVSLAEAILPGESAEVGLRWRSSIRNHRTRSGKRGKQVDMAQWYPKLAVYDADGWDDDAYRRGEFYGNFGEFEVQLDVPAEYTVAATGVPVAGDPGWDRARTRYREEEVAELEEDERRQVTFRASQVHDFAWSASPRFALVDTSWGDVDVHSFIREGDGEAWRDSVHVYAVRSLQWLEGLVGPYPYPQVSIVHGLLRGGMEYPMLNMNGRADEGLVLHELGHIYFFGILANDETAHAWLDEGFTTWQTRRYLRNRYGEDGKKDDWSLWKRLTPHETLGGRVRRQDVDLYRRGRLEPVDTHSHDFEKEYGRMVYGRASLFLEHLSAYLGQETFDRGLKLYYERWKLDHVTEDRFRRALEDASGVPLKSVFQQWLRQTDVIDYGIDDVESEERADGKWETRVTVERVGDYTAPIDLKISAPGDEVAMLQHHGLGRVAVLEATTNQRPTGIRLDPDDRWHDADRRNDTWPQDLDWGFDWPFVDERNEDAYSIRARPGGWYNDIDGARVGLNLVGGYGRWFDRTHLGFWWSEQREVLDIRLHYSQPSRLLRRFGKHGFVSMRIEDVEGVERARISLDREGRPAPGRHPVHHVHLSLGRESVEAGLGDRDEWDAGDTHAFEFAYDVHPRVYPFELGASVHYRQGLDLFSSEFEFQRAFLLGSVRTSFGSDTFRSSLRVFLGAQSKSAPAQERFRVAGAGPRQRHEAPWLSSPGALPSGMVARLPGDGDVCGYAAGDHASQYMTAVGFQASTALRVPLVGGALKRLGGKVRVGVFTDMALPSGAGSEEINGALFDAGLSFHGRLLGKLPVRLNLPLWVSDPELIGEGEKAASWFRWSLQISAPWAETRN